MKPKIILSMTTLPCRFNRLKGNLESILNQSYKFDKLIINIDDNLTKEDYKMYNELKNIDKRIKINKSEAKWRSCNKLLPTLKLYPNDVIVTIDDDIFYPTDSIKELVEQYNKTPDCIIAHEINPIKINHNKKYVTYYDVLDVKIVRKQYGKYLSNCCLFPPHVFNNTDLYDYDKMMECTNGTHDELWFWVQSTINNVQVVGLNYVRTFYYDTLTKYSDDEYRLSVINGNDDTRTTYMNKINELYGERLYNAITSKKIEFNVNKNNFIDFLYNLEDIKAIYGDGFVIHIDNNITKGWLSFIYNEIKKYFGANE